MSPTDTVIKIARRSPKGFAFTISGVSLTMFISAGFFLWNLSAKQALAADRVHRLEGQVVKTALIANGNQLTVHDNEQGLKLVRTTLGEVKQEQIRQTVLMNNILLELRK